MTVTLAMLHLPTTASPIHTIMLVWMVLGSQVGCPQQARYRAMAFLRSWQPRDKYFKFYVCCCCCTWVSKFILKAISHQLVGTDTATPNSIFLPLFMNHNAVQKFWLHHQLKHPTNHRDSRHLRPLCQREIKLWKRIVRWWKRRKGLKG